MSGNVASRQLARLNAAHTCVRLRKSGPVAGYRTRCLELPALLRKAGACQVITYLSDAGDEDTKAVLADLTAILQAVDVKSMWTANGAADAELPIQQLGLREYLALSAELLDAAEALAIIAHELPSTRAGSINGASA